MGPLSDAVLVPQIWAYPYLWHLCLAVDSIPEPDDLSKQRVIDIMEEVSSDPSSTGRIKALRTNYFFRSPLVFCIWKNM